MSSRCADSNANPATPGAPAEDLAEAARALSLDEAAASYHVSKRTLLRALSFGDIDGFKVRGVRGKEWRVTTSALTQAGYAARGESDAGKAGCAHCRKLREQLAVELTRNSELDNRLGHALMTAGRLRGELIAAGIQPDTSFQQASDTIYLDPPAQETLDRTHDRHGAI